MSDGGVAPQLRLESCPLLSSIRRDSPPPPPPLLLQRNRWKAKVCELSVMWFKQREQRVPEFRSKTSTETSRKL